VEHLIFGLVQSQSQAQRRLAVRWHGAVDARWEGWFAPRAAWSAPMSGRIGRHTLAALAWAARTVCQTEAGLDASDDQAV